MLPAPPMLSGLAEAAVLVLRLLEAGAQALDLLRRHFWQSSKRSSFSPRASSAAFFQSSLRLYLSSRTSRPRPIRLYILPISVLRILSTSSLSRASITSSRTPTFFPGIDTRLCHLLKKRCIYPHRRQTACGIECGRDRIRLSGFLHSAAAVSRTA